jgi:hypothetical protein
VPVAIFRSVPRRRWWLRLGALAAGLAPALLLVTATPPAGRIAAAAACAGPSSRLTGVSAQPQFLTAAADHQNVDLTSWTSTAVGVAANHALSVTSTHNGMCLSGGVVDGRVNGSMNWTATHSYGGYGYLTTGAGVQQVSNARIHNVEDGWKPRELAPNTGTMSMTGAYMTGIRDDAIEDDGFMPGDIADSLFDGTWCFLSEQNQGGVSQSIGAGEDTHIRITRVLVRLYPTNGGETGAGHWFKWQPRGLVNHSLVITDSTFAVASVPRLGWSNLAIPAGTQWAGNNTILWLGTPGGYGGPRPAGVHFVEGAAAVSQWGAARNAWLVAHGYPTKPVTDLNPMDDPVTHPGTQPPAPTGSSTVGTTPAPSHTAPPPSHTAPVTPGPSGSRTPGPSATARPSGSSSPRPSASQLPHGSATPAPRPTSRCGGSQTPEERSRGD